MPYEPNKLDQTIRKIRAEQHEQERRGSLRVRIVGVDAADQEHDLGVFNQGVVMKVSKLVDVASGQTIIVNDSYGKWRDGFLKFERVFIQGVVT